MILVGKLFHEVCACGGEYSYCSAGTLDQAIQKCVPARKAEMLDLNRKAVELGAKQ